MIPEPALLKDADQRIGPHAIWAVQHGCQRLVVMLNDTDTVMRLACSDAMQSHCLCD